MCMAVAQRKCTTRILKANVANAYWEVLPLISYVADVLNSWHGNLKWFDIFYSDTFTLRQCNALQLSLVYINMFFIAKVWCILITPNHVSIIVYVYAVKNSINGSNISFKCLLTYIFYHFYRKFHSCSHPQDLLPISRRWLSSPKSVQTRGFVSILRPTIGSNFSKWN